MQVSFTKKHKNTITILYTEPGCITCYLSEHLLDSGSGECRIKIDVDFFLCHPDPGSESRTGFDPGSMVLSFCDYTGFRVEPGMTTKAQMQELTIINCDIVSKTGVTDEALFK